MSAADLSVSFPQRGVIRLQSRSLFGDVDHPACRRFVERVFQTAEITGMTIGGGTSPHAELRFCPRTSRLDQVVGRIVALLRQDSKHGDILSRAVNSGHMSRASRVDLDVPAWP
jgi:hypothetical protein